MPRRCTGCSRVGPPLPPGAEQRGAAEPRPRAGTLGGQHRVTGPLERSPCVNSAWPGCSCWAWLFCKEQPRWSYGPVPGGPEPPPKDDGSLAGRGARPVLHHREPATVPGQQSGVRARGLRSGTPKASPVLQTGKK